MEPNKDIFSQVTPEAVAKIPYEIARRYSVMPIRIVAGTLELAIENPQDLDVIDTISFRANCNIHPVKAVRTAILAAMEKHYFPQQEQPVGGPLVSDETIDLNAETL